jgi:8-hydroxy-5-deazaflavin:NADPH oxidoreductase
MKIGIIGSGNVGGTLGKAWARAGHQVFFGFRNPESAEAQGLVRAAGSSAVASTVKEAAQAAEVVVLATPWEAAQQALSAAADVSGKVLIDTTNPLLPGLAGLAVGTNTSAGELVAQWAPGARVVKAFNTVGFNIMANSAFPQGKAALFYCGDDREAKATVAQLATQLGFEALDAGPLTQCRVLEPFAMLWISLALKYGYTRDIAFQLMRRTGDASGT